MTSVARSASAGDGAPDPTDRVLARAAWRGDRSALDALLDGHGDAAWRLAWLMAGDEEAATDDAADGLVRAIRSGASLEAGEAIGDRVLAGVYAASLDRARAGAPPAPAVPGSPLATAVRSLPERWRAAVWLCDVEGIDRARAATVLGVTPAVVAQLLDRGRRSLALRLESAGLEVPPELAPALLAAPGAAPGAVAEAATARWQQLTGPVARLGRLGPAATERASKAVGAAAGGLLAVGMIGIGIIGPGLGSLAPSPAAAAATGGGAGSFQLGSAVRRSHAPVAFSLVGALMAGPASAGRAGGPAGTAPTGATGGAGVGTAATGSGGSGTGAAGTGSGSTGSGGSTGGTGAVGSGGTGSSTGGSGGSGSGGTGGGSGSTGGGSGTGVSVPGVATVQVCPDGLTFSALGITALSQCPPSTPTTTLAAPSPTTTAPSSTTTTTTLPPVTTPPISTPVVTVPSVSVPVPTTTAITPPSL